MNGLAPICPYCGQFSAPATGQDIYPHRSDLFEKKFFRCVPCTAWVSVHAKTGEPMGSLANAKLRKLRSAVHKVFDPLWTHPANSLFLKKSSKKVKLSYLLSEHRKAAYANLAQKMGLPIDECHIAMFDEAQCRKAVDLINSREIYRHDSKTGPESQSRDQESSADNNLRGSTPKI